MEYFPMASQRAVITVFVVLFAGCGRQEHTPQPGKVLRVEKIDGREAHMDPLVTERDQESLQGKWELVALKRDWVEAKKDHCYYVFKGATMTVFPKDRRPSYYTLKLDASKSPKVMDIIATFDDGKVSIAEVIYELDGDT